MLLQGAYFPQPVRSRTLQCLSGVVGSTGAKGTVRSDDRLTTVGSGRLRERCATPAPIRWNAAP